MNHFNCPYDPFTCDYSVFFELIDKSGGVKRWVECADYHYTEDPITKKMKWFESESHRLTVDGSEIVIKKGDLCINNPEDWWVEYKKSSKRECP